MSKPWMGKSVYVLAGALLFLVGLALVIVGIFITNRRPARAA